MVVTFGDAFLAVDWGTTNRRVFLIEGGRVVREEQDDHGVKSVAAGAFEADVAAIRERMGDLPMLLAGMVGSTIGWREAAYVAAPADLRALADNLLWVDARTAIIPGISTLAGGLPDVMRGEEVQLLGAVAGGMAPPTATIAQPGTHCKWVVMEDGRIVDFVTAMTGELFAMLRSHSVLAAQLQADATVGPAFREGVEEAKRQDLAASLFRIRAAKLLGQRDDVDAASFASGLLIGSDVAVRMAQAPHDTIYILAGASLGALYAAAVEANGKRAVLLDSETAFVSGITHLARLTA